MAEMTQEQCVYADRIDSGTDIRIELMKLQDLKSEPVADAGQCIKSFTEYGWIQNGMTASHITDSIDAASGDTSGVHTCTCPFCDQILVFTDPNKHPFSFAIQCVHCGEWLFKHVCGQSNAVSVHKCFKCDVCCATFPVKSSLVAHVQMIHDTPCKCPFCAPEFGKKMALKVHVRSQAGTEPYSRRRCKIPSSSSNETQQHCSREHAGNFNCSYCKRTFHTSKSMKLHVIRAHERYKCPKCPKRFHLPSSLESHKLCHVQEETLKCLHCNTYFKDAESLENHKQRIRDKFTLTCICKCCGKSFRTKKCLEMHERVEHVELSYPCRHCDKSFRDTVQRTRHERVHTGEKPYKCAFCDKRFRTAGQTTAHERSHTGEKPYYCKFCYLRFAHVTTAKSHEKRMHGAKQGNDEQNSESSEKSREKKQTVKPLFPCRYCEEAFGESTERKLHECVHTGGEPHTCAFCNERFRTRDEMRSHANTHSGEAPFACRHCDQRFLHQSTKKAHEDSWCTAHKK